MKQLFSILLGIHRGSPRHSDWVLVCLEGAWPKLVGDRLAAVCRPARLKNSELVVEILDQNWEGAIKGVESVLQQKLDAETSGLVKTLSFTC